MKFIIFISISLLISQLIIGCSTNEVSSLNAPPEKLRVGEGFANPLGYYEKQPRFSWKLPSDQTGGLEQTAFQIQVATSIKQLQSAPNKWDSGKISSSSTSWISYKGQELHSREKVFWRVRIWDQVNSMSDWSPIQTIEMGLLQNNDWVGKWIGAATTDTNLSPPQEVIATPQYLRKPFTVLPDVQKARLYVTAKGVFKVFINGGDVAKSDVLTPGWTPYKKRIETLTYDVTPLLTSKENVISSTIAGGWYAGRIADLLDTDHKQSPRFLAQLEITYVDGSKEIIASDSTWKSTQDGPIRFASNYDGERYDQRYEMPGWKTHTFDDSGWSKVVVEDVLQSVNLRPKRHLPIREIETLNPISVTQTKPGTAIFDFGQNMVGVPSLSLPVTKGKQVSIRFAEALHKGAFYTENYRSAHSTDYYLPAKTSVINYKPTFTFHGYRYVEVSGFDETKKPNINWITANVQHSDIELYKNFNSSNPKLNKLFENINWGLKSNFFDIPLDCPQRDERLGWTGDANAFVTPSLYMSDSYGFWSAWLKSLREEQTTDGFVPLYIPYVKWIDWTSSGWGDAATILPWELYTMTGDVKILEDSYASMKAWVEYHKSEAKGYVSHMKTFGDWLQPYPEAEGKGANRGDTDFSLISTAFFARSVEMTAKTAKELNKVQDYEALSVLHAKITKAFRDTFFDSDLNVTKGKSTQTAYLLSLAYNLIPENERAQAQEKLIALLEASDMHLRTGFLGTPLLAETLQNAGRSDLVYELIFKETYPSWFYSINNGATTTWERWNSYSSEDGFNPQGMNSLNHYAYGTISKWFYEGILGIKPAKPGFKEITIAPQITAKLSFVEGSYPTPQGEVKVSWSTKNSLLTLDVVIPQNSTARVVIPVGYKIDKSKILNEKPISDSFDLQPGTYQFNLISESPTTQSKHFDS
ncbi:alpha-L-rhamnosidase [Paraglaciecola chathamensis]|uniref:alpha-L-rhamnosidase n=1 Tax=Paraglaciecola chathamensis S18K6 TaxID=1127672 RepID=A0AAV3V7Y3_9ALTE|nr:alpha-L-rhamnosidase [Paraglaciecola chathamensis]GAC12633.1 hypothetical protein GCHA_4716 [Paraglaciecola chathamensis S18K6]